MASKSIFGVPPTQVTSSYRRHAGQDEVRDAIRANFRSPKPASIVEIIASRGWGKTLFMVGEVLVPFLERRPDARAMWVGPTYNIALSPIVDVFQSRNELNGEPWFSEKDPQGNRVWEFSNGTHGPTLKWWNGAQVSFKSADSPDSIVSRGYNLIIIDEAALINEQVLTQQILGTARKKGIKIFIITSPRGKRHWTYKYYLKGQAAEETNYLSFSQPYTKNPHFNPTLAQLIKDLPDWLYRQEYMAEFLEDGDSVFKNIDMNLIEGEEIQYASQQQLWEGELGDVTVKGFDKDFVRKFADRRFVVGLDLAKSTDFTVITGMDLETAEVVYYNRFNKTDYKEVIRLAVEVCHKLNHAELIFDATGVGGSISDFLTDLDVTSHPYIFTNESKNDLITKLIMSIEYAELKIPNITTVKHELNAFTYEITRTGKISYNAPSGWHDDIVISLALSNWFRKEMSGPDEAQALEDMIADSSPENKNPYHPRSVLHSVYEDND